MKLFAELETVEDKLAEVFASHEDEIAALKKQHSAEVLLLQEQVAELQKDRQSSQESPVKARRPLPIRPSSSQSKSPDLEAVKSLPTAAERALATPSTPEPSRSPLQGEEAGKEGRAFVVLETKIPKLAPNSPKKDETASPLVVKSKLPPAMEEPLPPTPVSKGRSLADLSADSASSMERLHEEVFQAITVSTTALVDEYLNAVTSTEPIVAQRVQGLLQDVIRQAEASQLEEQAKMLHTMEDSLFKPEEEFDMPKLRKVAQGANDFLSFLVADASSEDPDSLDFADLLAAARAVADAGKNLLLLAGSGGRAVTDAWRSARDGLRSYSINTRAAVVPRVKLTWGTSENIRTVSKSEPMSDEQRQQLEVDRERERLENERKEAEFLERRKAARAPSETSFRSNLSPVAQSIPLFGVTKIPKKVASPLESKIPKLAPK